MITTNKNLFLGLCFFISCIVFSQNKITGEIKNTEKEKLPNVSVKLDGTSFSTTTDKEGRFSFENIASGNYFLVIYKDGYHQKILPIDVQENLHIPILLEEDQQELVELDVTELDASETSGSSVSFLQSSRSIFSQAAAFQWQWFRPRGLDSNEGRVYFNGIEMNKAKDGRPLWRNWGGLNDITRYPEELKLAMDPAEIGLGGFNTATSYSTRASNFAKGGRITASLTDRSYTQRLMATYSTGMMDNGWAIAASGSRRWAEEGVIDGTSYDAWSYFLAVEKKLNNKHSFNFTTFGAPYKRGSNSPLTQEMIDIFGENYNNYWGYQNGEKRNSRVKTTFEPVFQLTHYWDINEKSNLQTTLSYQFGHRGSTRFDYMGANPTVRYYRYWGSYYEKQGNDPLSADIYNTDPNARTTILNGQLNWQEFYRLNRELGEQGKGATNILANDREDDQTVAFNTHYKRNLNDNINLYTSLNYQYLFSNNYRKAEDLFGGLGFYDVDPFSTGSEAENNLLNPQRLINEGDRYEYDYDLHRHRGNIYAMLDFSYNWVDFYLAGDYTRTEMWRRGNYQNGRYPLNSYGVSDKYVFDDFGVKAGAVFKLSGQHFIKLNTGYQTTAPTTGSLFLDGRNSNYTVAGLESSKRFGGDLGYIYRSPKFKGQATFFYNELRDLNDANFYYGQTGFNLGTFTGNLNLQGESQGFFEEQVIGIDQRHLGVEIGAEYNISSAFKLIAAANIAEYVYTDDADLYLSTDDAPTGFISLGKTYIKNYKVGGAPQQTYSLGAEYYKNGWRLGATVNYLSNNYIDLSYLRRTDSFAQTADSSLDQNGDGIYDAYDPEIARQLLKQEKFDEQFMINLNFGKSIRIPGGNRVLASFMINNLLNNRDWKTGGFEDSRVSNYKDLLDETQLTYPVFGNKYFIDRGRTFFLNLSYIF
ncbi:MAG: carboxypeptidase-like regulatory domain-containing protein [Flavobacteriales bacterium]